MPKYKVLGGNWGEGHEVGDVIELDTNAAAHRLMIGEIEEVSAAPKKAKKAKKVEEEAPAEEAPAEEAAE